MVVIPARNEEATIARAVKSFRTTPSSLSTIIPGRHRRAGAAVGAGVLQAPDLTAQVVGKSNACAAGARVLRSRWVLFADADTWFDEGFLDAAVAAAEASGLALLSIYLRPEVEGFAESVLVPCAVALYFCGVSPGGDPTGLFAGQCVLVRREAYDFIGGHSPSSPAWWKTQARRAGARHRLKFATARAGGRASVSLAACAADSSVTFRS
jgi:glycosyltransferase involved in cell wall biosynthesis